MAHLYPTTLRYIQERRALGELTGASPRTQTYILAAFAEAVGPHLPTSRLHRRHITRWMVDLENSGICEATRYTRFAIVRTFCRWMVVDGVARRDPTLGVKGPRRRKAQPRALTVTELGAALEACDDRLTVCVLLACQDGLRRAEILHLTIGDVDADRLVRVFGKGSRERWVPISDETVDAVGRYLSIYPGAPSVPLIRSYQHPGRGIHPDHLTRLIQTAFTEAGVKARPLDGKSLHAGRHTCAVDMLEHGADVRDVQEFLGHQYASTTLDMYGNRHHATGRLREAAAGRSYLPGR